MWWCNDMAELLIKAIDAVHSDPVKDQRGCYKLGDPVCIRSDGFQWGALEALPPAQGGKFVIIKLPGVTIAQIKVFVTTRWPAIVDLVSSEPDRRRRIRIDTDLLPANVRNQLRNTGSYSTTWANLRGFVRDKVSNTTA